MSWGYGPWGYGGWGGTATVIGDNAPLIIQRTPVSGDTNVREDAALAVVFFDADGDLDVSTLNIRINGALVYNGSVFSAGYTGGVFTSVGRTVIRITNLSGWGYGVTVQVKADVADLSANSVSETWSWTTRANPACYAGTAALPIEKQLITPLSRFLNLEVIRKTLLNTALRTRDVPYPDQRAARVVYQLGFDTEINTILNPYELRDEAALRTTVCERQASLIIAEAVQVQKKYLVAGIQALRSQGVISEEYAKSFQDYIENVQYAYRVSLAANLVLLAHSVEANAL